MYVSKLVIGIEFGYHQVVFSFDLKTLSEDCVLFFEGFQLRLVELTNANDLFVKATDHLLRVKILLC